MSILSFMTSRTWCSWSMSLRLGSQRVCVLVAVHWSRVGGSAASRESRGASGGKGNVGFEVGRVCCG